MTYCSSETRKVLDVLDEYGLTVDRDDMLRVEQAVGRFWNTHIQKVIRDIMKNAKVERIEALGVWEYFEKPIISMLTPRGAAARTDPIEFEIDEHVEKVYNLVTSSLLLADFNMKELALLVGEIPSMAPDVITLANAITACKRQGVRSVYYLHGVVQREHQTTQGRIKEIQKQTAEAADQGWRIPDSYDKMDITERRSLADDWKDRLNSIQIAKALNAKAQES
jgi:hypothetical protein